MLPGQEGLLSKLQIQLKRQFRCSSLKTLCARKVVDYLPLFAKKGLTKISHILPKPLFALVYQTFLETHKANFKYNTYHESISWEEWLCLINPGLVEKVFFFAEDGIKDFDCSVLDMPRKAKLKQFGLSNFFQKLASGSPMIESLKDHWNELNDYYYLPTQLLMSDYYSLQLMPRLVVLENTIYPVKDNDLQIIGRCLPLLQRLVLLAKIPEDLSSEGLICLQNLKFLKQLTFDGPPLNHGSIQLVTWCLFLLPQATVLAKMKNRYATHQFPLYKCPVELGLEHLVLGENSVIPPNVTLPAVNQITINNATTIPLQQFKKVRCMSFASVNFSQVREALLEVGHLLKKLSFSGHYSDLMTVFQLCPNLIELNLLDCHYFFNSFYDHPQLTNGAQNLKSFKYEKIAAGDSDGLLHFLLTSCPLLENLEMDNIKLTKSELDLIHKDMKIGAIAIQKLQKVVIVAKVSDEDETSFSEFALSLCEKNCCIFKEVCIARFCIGYISHAPEYELAQEVQYFINTHQYLNGLAKMLPEQEEILENVKAQLKNQVRCASLKILCARKVADSLPLYVKKGLTKLSPLLSKPLFTLVYHAFLKSCKEDLNNEEISWEDWLYHIKPDLVEKVLFFVADGVEEFDCSILNYRGDELQYMHFRVRQFGSVLFERLARGSPNLRSFKDNLDLWYSVVPYDGLLSDHYKLQLMSKLVVLEINQSPVKDADLQIIGLCLLQLQELLLLTCDHQHISYEGLKNLTKLKKLDKFTFIVDWHFLLEAKVQQLLMDCLLLMPQVKFLAKDRKGLYLPHKFPTYEGPIELGLEHLVMGKSSVIPSNVILPKVLQITVCEATPISLLQFKKLRHLSLSGNAGTELKQSLLTVNAHLLQKLSLSCCTCDLMQVLQLCPNLEEVKLFNTKFVGSIDATQLTDKVHRLKIFNYKPQDSTGPKIDSHGFLHLLFTSCPELQDLVIRGISLKKQELELINTDALAIQKLQNVEIIATVEKEGYVAFAEFIINFCVQNCTTLKKVAIKEIVCENSAIVPKYDLAQKIQYFIKKHKYIGYLEKNLKF